MDTLKLVILRVQTFLLIEGAFHWAKIPENGVST